MKLAIVVAVFLASLTNSAHSQSAEEKRLSVMVIPLNVHRQPALDTLTYQVKEALRQSTRLTVTEDARDAVICVITNGVPVDDQGNTFAVSVTWIDCASRVLLEFNVYAMGRLRIKEIADTLVASSDQAIDELEKVPQRLNESWRKKLCAEPIKEDRKMFCAELTRLTRSN